MKDTTLRGYGHTVIEAPFTKKVNGEDVTEPGWQLLFVNLQDGELIRYPMNEESKADLLAKLSGGIVRATHLPTPPV
jgi:hypothetical protein